MSPEMYKIFTEDIMKDKDVSKNYKFYQKSDTFSYGLIILHLILLPK